MKFSHPFLTRLSWLALIACAGGWFQPAAVQAEVTPEYKLKAVYLFNIVRFVKWPTNAFLAADSPLVIGILGENPFDHELEKLMSGKVVGGRTVTVKRVAAAAEATPCQVVFIPASEQANLLLQLATLRTAPVLTVGECAEFLDEGGVIEFFVQQNKIRFNINKAQADTAGVQLDSQLLSLANTVRQAVAKNGGKLK